MRTLTITHEVPLSELKFKMKTAKTISDFKRWQIIYLASSYSVDGDYLSDVTGYSKANIYSIVQQFNNSLGDISIKAKGGRRRELMSIDEEKNLMKGLEDKALNGQILSYKDIKKIIEIKINKEVSDDFLWDLFKRNGWTKHSPRPQHPKKDKEKQKRTK